MSPLLFALLSTASAQEPTELQLAYQREFAYLQEEKRSLDARRRGVAAEEDERTATAENELARLQAKLLGLRTQRELLEDQLSAAVRDADGVSEARELVESTLFQAQSTLGVTLPEGEELSVKAGALQQAYEAGVQRLERAGQLRAEPGRWFRADGSTVQGEVLRWGEVAAFGVGPHSGVLLPVGEGRLQLLDDTSGPVAEAVAAGQAPDTVKLFLFEDASKRVEQAPEKTWMSTLQAGGIVGVVILALGLVAWLLAAVRTATLFVAGRGRDAVTAAIGLLDQHRWGRADEIVQTASGAAPRVMAALLPLGPGSRKRLEDRASEALLLEQPALDRFGGAILVIAAVAPLLGLLGTVTGMIGTFEIITEFGTGDPRMLSGGISEALVTTQLGLIVAIPTLLVGNLLDRYAERVLGQLELAALAVINRSEPEFDEAEEGSSLSPEPALRHDEPTVASHG
jgi:biopolymer transport protein ExbB